ncbi:MAG: response regulator [Bacteroidetes bacterium]|nr:response regulator [Bacteroidota bacterium]
MNIPEFLSGGGEMGQRIREYDWSSTPLGPIETWPQSLRTCIRIMLTSRQPIWIGWGPQLIKFYNDPYKAIVGGKHPWALGRPAREVWKEIWPEIGPMLRQVMEMDQGTYVEAALLIMHRNGYDEEVYYTFSYTPIPGDHGGTEGMICYNSDDTTRILSERQLKTLMRLSNELTESKSSEETIERTIRSLEDNPHDFPFIEFKRGTAPAGRKLQVIEEMTGPMTKGAWEVEPHKGVVIPIFESGSQEGYGYLTIGLNPYRLLDDRYMNFLSQVADQIAGSLADLHALEVERKRSEALAEIDRAKTTFFSNISHEFRTPLTLLLGPIEDVLSDPESKEINRYRMGIAYRNVLRMQKLVNTLLDFSRIEAGRMEGKYSPVDIFVYTRDLASSFRSAIEKAGMELEVTSGPITAEVYVDVDLWEQIILNLVSNAFKYSRQGRIGVHVEQDGEQVLISVSDTGVGIPAEQIGKIFERFHRVEGTQGRSQEGTGIGLAMVKELVRLHQGTIDVESVVGVGSTFSVRIPTGRGHLPAEKIVVATKGRAMYAEAFVEEAMKWLPSERENDEPQSADATILLADDNADMREYVERLLSKQFRVITAMNGFDAFEKTLEHRPDLVLSDIMMPQIDGFGLLKLIRTEPSIQHTPVIFLSARAGEEAKVEGLDAGADDYLVKPFSAKELLARVDANIKIARSRLEYAVRLEREVEERTKELKTLNFSLRQSNEDLQQFAHVASHDLKEPVRKIKTFSNRLREEYAAALPEQARIFLSKIEQATGRMFSMIEGVLSYSFLNGGVEETGTVDLNKVLSDIESDLEVVIGERKATIERDVLPVVQGAELLLYQLFYNLINNSLKFVRAGVAPVIAIRAETKGDTLGITLSDNGIGFEPEYAERIFNTFTRLHAKDKFEGTGLGLALCKKIVERHHGHIEATGMKNVGATFSITLPLRQEKTNI